MPDDHSHDGEFVNVRPDGPPRVRYADGCLACVVCRSCGEPYDAADMHHNKAKPDGVETICRECYTEAARDRRQPSPRRRRTCTAPDCTAPHKAHGLCSAHYQAAYRDARR